MTPEFPSQTEPFRQRIRDFLAEHLPEGWSGLGGLPTEEAPVFVDRWREVLRDNGLLAPMWPTEVGGAGLTHLEAVILAEEFARAGVPTGGYNDVFNIGMIGNTLLHWGTPEQQQYFLPKLLSGEHVWCQGYSEPNAGSDLAGLGCRAELDGDEWVINGQKIWTTYGHLANHIFLLVRSDPDAPRHRGITFLLVPMDQPGVEVRPIAMMSGESEFNEVFFTDARVPRENVVGQINGGWSVAMTLLGFERGEASAVGPLRFREEFDRLAAMARERGLNTNPIIRDRLARCYTRVEIMRFMGLRSLTGFLAGQEPGPESALYKINWSEHHQEISELALDILGAEAMTPTGRRRSTSMQTDDPGAPNDSASWVGTLYVARGGTIYAGTSQVQRNIIAERILGLPKEPA